MWLVATNLDTQGYIQTILFSRNQYMLCWFKFQFCTLETILTLGHQGGIKSGVQPAKKGTGMGKLSIAMVISNKTNDLAVEALGPASQPYRTDSKEEK